MVTNGDHEAQLKVKDKRIAELEAMKTKTCEGCKHKPNEGESYYDPCGTCARFFMTITSQRSE